MVKYRKDSNKRPPSNKRLS